MGAFAPTAYLFDVEDHWISADLRQRSAVGCWRRTLISRQTDQTSVLCATVLEACDGTETQLEKGEGRVSKLC